MCDDLSLRVFYYFGMDILRKEDKSRAAGGVGEVFKVEGFRYRGDKKAEIKVGEFISEAGA